MRAFASASRSGAGGTSTSGSGSGSSGARSMKASKDATTWPNASLSPLVSGTGELAGASALLATAGAALAQEPIGKGITMYMQMGGTAGDGATLARQTGAAEAAAAFGVDLKAQFSAWAPETMINQFKEAVAAKPTCIEIMGHPGGTAFHDNLVQVERAS